jgi:hypothetical protein
VQLEANRGTAQTGDQLSLEHVSSKHARIFKRRAIEPITWIAMANPIN